jgi:predicted amidohydrolase YtcJ
MKMFMNSLVMLYVFASAVIAETADTIYYNGTILTIVDAQPRVEAVAVNSKALEIGEIGADTEKHGPGDRRPVLIHGQFLREDQVDSIKSPNIVPSLFPMHTFYWGDWHRDHTVGPLLADNISPTGWCVQRSMKFTSHHDAPVAFPNSMRVLDATVTRRSRSGDIIGPAQRVDVMTALKEVTIWSAWQHFEEETKGSIETGKLADLVILDMDPTAVDPEMLDQIKVVETIKEGVTVFSMEDAQQTAIGHQYGNGAALAFTRTIQGVASHFGQDSRHHHEIHNGCLCGTISQLAAIISGGE